MEALLKADATARSSKRGRLAILSLAGWAFLAGCVYCDAVFLGDTLYSTSSPDRKYKVEIVQRRDLTLYERWVYMTALRNGKTIVYRKLLYTGDILDNDFRDLYPGPRWVSHSILELGDLDSRPDERTSELKIANETSSTLSYVLVESGLRKVVIFEVEPKSGVDVDFRVRGGLSCEGGYAGSKKRFGVAAEVVGNGIDGVGSVQTKERLVIRIRVGTSDATMESPQVALRPGHCCASDRPDYEHE